MAGSMTDAWENKLLDGVVGNIQCSTPQTVYLAAFTVDPGEGSDFSNEVSGGGYARVDLAGKFGSASGGQVSNNSDIVFPEATADWGTVTHVAICQSSGGTSAEDMLVTIQLSSGQDITSGSQFKIQSGKLTITAD